MIKKNWIALLVFLCTSVTAVASSHSGKEPPKLPPRAGSVTSEVWEVPAVLPGSDDAGNGINIDEEIARKVAEEGDGTHQFKVVGDAVKSRGKLEMMPHQGPLTSKIESSFPERKVTGKIGNSGTGKGAIYSTYGYISKDLSAMTGDYVYSPIRITKRNGEYIVANIYGMDTLSVCSIDETARTITIPAQKIGYSSTYGNVWIMPIEWNGNQGTAKRNGNIVGTFNDDGSISFGGWGVLVYDGPYAGSAFNYFRSSEAICSNASAVITKSDGAVTNTSLVEQPYANLISIYNLAENGNPVQGRVNKDGTITITPQMMLTLNLYGDFYIYPYDASANKVNTQGSLTATYSDGVISIPPYAIVAKESSNVAWLKASGGAQITCRDFTLQVPEPMEVKFEGEGTQASPYLIKSGEDMLALSQSVNDGNSYRGKYLRVANDFSMKNISRAYVAAGDNELPFAGEFDGNGKTISDLTIAGMGFNYQGVFGFLDAEGRIKNLTLDKLNVSGTGARMGGLVGEMNGDVSNVHLTNSVLTTKGDMLGGIAGYSRGTVDKCSYSGSITGVNYVGGMVAFNLYRITNCWSDALIYANGKGNNNVNSVGGIVGTHYTNSSLPGRATVSECWFGGIIDDANGYSKTSGIAAYCTNSVVEKCLNIGIISGSNANNNATPDDYDSSLTGTTIYDNSTGGICATINTNTLVTDCVNAGTILKSKTSNRVGGIVGYISLGYANNKPYNPSSIVNCVNTGYINSSPNDDRERRGIWGGTWVKYGYNIGELCVENCWSDNQATGLMDTIYGKRTSELTSGKLPDGFQAEIWTADNDRYLTLAAFAGTPQGSLATANHLMGDDESVKKFKGPGTLRGDKSVDFWVYNDKQYVKSYEAISISGNTTTAGSIYDNVLMVARTTDGGMMKYMPVNVVPNTYEGRGTKENPYILRTVADFKRLNSGISEAYQSHDFDYFKLANDIDFQLGDEFKGFAYGVVTTAAEFGGTFDGDGHTISGLKIDGDRIDAAGNPLVGTYPYVGLFHVLNKYATVRNLTLDASCRIGGYTFTGAFAGYCAGLLENCRNYASVSNLTTATGGLVGGLTATGRISSCYNGGSVTSGYNVAGGIAGYNLGRIELSQNDGNVTGKILSVINEDETKFIQYGGISGYANAGITDRCVNNGSITGAVKVGGISGSHGASDVLGGMFSCINTGIVESIINSTNIGGISGGTENSNVMGSASSLYFDKQMTTAGSVANANVEGAVPSVTSVLTSGTTLDGLDASVFDYKANAYPVLKAFAGDAMVNAMRSAYVVINALQNRSNVTSEAVLSQNEKLVWKLAKGEVFAINGNKLTVNNTTGSAARDTLMAYWDGKLIKTIAIGNVPAAFDGSGTEESPFQLRTVADLTKLALIVNDNGMEYENIYFKVMNDIAYGESDEFTPISMPSGSMQFKGVLDGGGHAISGYNYESALDYTGFIGTLGESGVVKNLTLGGAMAGKMYTGGFVGKLYGRMENCVNQSTVTSTTSNAGGLVGTMCTGSAMLKCVNKGKVGETMTSSGTNTPTLTGGLVAVMESGSLMDSCSNIVDRNARSTVGGLVSRGGGVIRNSYNTGNIISATTGGGLVGTSEKTLELYDCWNTGNVSTLGTASNMGGLVGSSSAASTVKVIRCWNSGNISGSSSVGGLFGTYPTGAMMRDCWNSGDVTGTSTNVGGFAGTGNGSVNYPSLITNCYNTGSIVSAKANLGGLCGNIANGLVVDSCVNYGKVEMKATAAAGSIGGCVGNLAGTISNCWNAGEVITTAYSAGGVIGTISASTGVAVYCVNVGKVSSTGAYGNTGSKPIYGNAAGIAGTSMKGKSTIKYCANLGEITAPDMVAGIIGAACVGDTIIHCYNAGRVTATKETPAWVDPVVLFYQTTSTTTNGTPENVYMAGMYYDSDVNSFTPQYQALSTPLSTRKLMDVKMEGFQNMPYCYPMIGHLSHAAEVNLYSVGMIPEKETEDLANLTGRIYIGMADHLVWSGSDNVKFGADGVVETLAKGDGYITVATDSELFPMSRKVNISVSKPTSGVDSVDADVNPVSVKYYDLSGNRVAATHRGDVVICVTEYDNGTRAVEKIVIR